MQVPVFMGLREQENHVIDRSASFRNRRHFLGTLASAGAVTAAGDVWSQPARKRPRIAAVFTEFRFRSHAYNILENFFDPYLFNGQLVDPGVDIVAFYADQFPLRDMARRVASRRRIPLFGSIGEALRVGGQQLDVDGVLSIGEHGDSPLNSLGQKMYPRKRFFDEMVQVMQQSQRYVPIFNDKHLSYRWDWGLEMYRTAQQLGIPLMAGSSVPLAERRPSLELDPGVEIEEAVSVHGGGLESYDFHAFEVLQSMVESRQGGETGISQVQLVSGNDLNDVLDRAQVSRDLVDAAMAAESRTKSARQPRPNIARGLLPEAPPKPGTRLPRPRAHVVRLVYADGLRAALVKVGNTSDRWNFACRLRGRSQPQATAFYNGPWGNRCLFKALSHAIQHLFVTRSQPYPVERTLLATGVLEAAMQSFARGGQAVRTPHLELDYAPIDFRAMRERGDSWKLITTQTAQPADFAPGDRRFLRRSR